MMSSAEIDDRLRKLLDQDALHHDTLYNVQFRLFRTWITHADMAMEDEGVDPAVARRVINRMLFGCPSGADSQERMMREKQMIELIQNTPMPMSISPDRWLGSDGNR